jgi:hypothetical protein
VSGLLSTTYETSRSPVYKDIQIPTIFGINAKHSTLLSDTTHELPVVVLHNIIECKLTNAKTFARAWPC